MIDKTLEGYIADLRDGGNNIVELADALAANTLSAGTTEQLVAAHEKMTAIISGILHEVAKRITRLSAQVEGSSLPTVIVLSSGEIQLQRDLTPRERQALIGLKKLTDTSVHRTTFTGNEVAEIMGPKCANFSHTLRDLSRERNRCGGPYTQFAGTSRGLRTYRLTELGMKFAATLINGDSSICL